jgi:hypothetical protein
MGASAGSALSLRTKPTTKGTAKWKTEGAAKTRGEATEVKRAAG